LQSCKRLIDCSKLIGHEAGDGDGVWGLRRVPLASRAIAREVCMVKKVRIQIRELGKII